MTHSPRPLSWLRYSVRRVLDFAFPPQCADCGAVDYPATAGTGTYCPDCVQELCPAPLNRCLCCGAEIGVYASSANGCTHCRNRTLRFDSVVCLGMYEGSLRRAILGAKWSFSAVRMRSLARLFADCRRDDLLSLNIDHILPIPQHWRQRMVRHFNPAWIIAEELSNLLAIPCDPHLLRRQRRTRPQKRVAVSQRFENQADSFSLRDSHLVRGKRLLLVDDVLTTGATCSQAARLLKSEGATECHVSVLGRVLDHSA